MVCHFWKSWMLYFNFLCGYELFFERCGMRMRVLVVVQDYPNLLGGKSEAYVHTRNVEYIKAGIAVDVLNFSAKKTYVIDGICVLCEAELEKQKLTEYDCLICHAANIRNHYRFIKKNKNAIKQIYFFFHGHEILKIHKVYPPDYYYVKTNPFETKFQDVYDSIKCKIWNHYFRKTKNDFYCVFVSNWMYNEFQKWVKVDLRGQFEVIYNVVGVDFIKMSYDSTLPKEYDYVTIRSNLDGSKYCIDLVNELAKNNPKSKFLVVGKGEFFQHFDKANNLTWINRTMSHAEVIEVLNSCRCALMPTKTDAQGVMACEFATFGIPMITSSIPVCQEVFNEFDNVAYINNDDGKVDLEKIYLKLENRNTSKVLKYDLQHTVQKEIELFKGRSR